MSAKVPLWVGLGAALAAGTACPPARARPEELPPQVALEDVTLRYFQGAQISAAGRARRLTYERDTTDFVAYEALMRFPSRASSAMRAPGAALSGMEVRAPEVRGNLGTKRADGLGGVAMRSSGGMVGTTQRAHFDGVSMHATGVDPVDIVGPGYRLTAQDFNFSFKDDAYAFDGATTWLGQAPP